MNIVSFAPLYGNIPYFFQEFIFNFNYIIKFILATLMIGQKTFIY